MKFSTLKLDAGRKCLSDLKCCLTAIVLAGCLCKPQLAFADVFLFRDGRVISGSVADTKVLKVDGKQVTQFTVLTRAGAYVQIVSTDLQLQGHRKPTDFELEYIEEYKKRVPKTAEEHCDLAGWCLSKRLKDLALAHFEAALDIDPQNSRARTAAGYDEDENGRWVKEEVVMGLKRGMVHYKNRWIYPEELAILEAKEKDEAEMAEVKKGWTFLNNQAAFLRSLSPDVKQSALNKIRQIQDPRAVPIFSEHLLATGRKQAPAHVRIVYVELLGRFPFAAGTLANASVTDPEQAVRNACLDALRGANKSAVVPVYLSFLSSKNNDYINRAAEGLGQFNPEEAILPLIEHLVTTHEFQAGNGQGMNVNSQGGLSFGGNKKVKKPINNGSVLSTLSQITNQNFEYDKQRWLTWYAYTYAKSARDLRRDL